MYCNHCGKQVVAGSRFCSECGTPLGETKTAQSSQTITDTAAGTSSISDTTIGTRDEFKTSKLVYPRNPPLSPHLCWVNFFLVGLAQMIHGQVAKGFTIIGVTILVGLIFFPATLVLSLITILDAFLVGWKLKRGKPVGKWQFFPL